MNIATYRAFGNVRKVVIGLLLVGASSVSSQASAALVLFTFTGSATASFTLDQSPTPSLVNPNNARIDDITGTFQGTPATLRFGFGTGGDFYLVSATTEINGFGGVPFFSGTTAAPTFLLGTYFFPGFSRDFNTLPPVQTPGEYTLSITRVSDAVPEPSTWMMMVAGFGLLGGTVRYRRSTKPGTQTLSLT